MLERRRSLKRRREPSSASQRRVQSVGTLVRRLSVAQRGVIQSSYRCPNGHLFVIGECGGAMQVGRCVECGAPVGGQNHRVLEGNSAAADITV